MKAEELETLYRDQFQRVYNYVYYRVLDPAAAEDVTSDVFLKVVKHRHCFDPSKASFSTWVMRIAHNTLVDYYRTRKVCSSIDELGSKEPRREDEYRALDDLQTEVARLLSYLSPEDREIYLRYHEEKKNVDIAKLLDMNPATVATRVRRALRTMRAHVQHTDW